MNRAKRFAAELGGMVRILHPRDFLVLLTATATNLPAILASQKLTSLDAAMSRNMMVRFNGSRVVLPLEELDRIMAAENNNPTFGNVREMYARNCYLRHLRFTGPQSTVLDLGANCGLFSLLALVALAADVAVGVEPYAHCLPALEVLLQANNCDPLRAPRYTKFATSPTAERKDPQHFVSFQTIFKEQNIARFNLVKIDIEGDEKALFSEPEWLKRVDTITMELHPHLAGDLSLIPDALARFGFAFRLMDQDGKPAAIQTATFLCASRVGALAD